MLKYGLTAFLAWIREALSCPNPGTGAYPVLYATYVLQTGPKGIKFRLRRCLPPLCQICKTQLITSYLRARTS